MTQPAIPYPPNSPTPPKSSSLIKLIVLALVIVAVVALFAGGLYYGGTQIYQASLRPNIQVTNVNIGQSTTNPRTARTLDDGRVTGQVAFDYTTSLPGTYSLYFDNSFSVFSSKAISLSYTVGGTNDMKAISIPAGNSYYLSFDLAENVRITGSFTVAGGSGNDVNFYITAATCTETIPFTFSLVNPGQSNGFATVNVLVDGTQTQWSNRYFVPQGQQVAESGSIPLTNCNAQTVTIVVSSQEKA